MGRVARLACAAGLVIGLVAVPARADKMTDAEDLFRRAKVLMAEQKHREACVLLEESEKLDPQMGTLLNLAICHENIGKIASAWGEFRAVEQQAKVAGREDRVKLAHDRAAKLEPRLARLKIVVPPDVKVQGLVVKVDGEKKDEPLWSGVAVDPGTRIVEASAPKKKPATVNVKVDDEGVSVTVTVPKLDDAPEPPPAAVAKAEPPYEKNRARRTLGFIAGGAGLAALTAGGVFGVLAITSDAAATDACPQPCIRHSTRANDADSKTDRALLFANVSNVALPLGVIAAAVGIYLVVTTGPTKRPEPKSERAFLSPAFAGVTW